MANSFWYEVGRALRTLLLSNKSNKVAPSPTRTTDESAKSPTRATSTGRTDGEASPGQFGDGATRDVTQGEISQIQIEYTPHPDGDPDPGEVVWTWVPYAEHDGRGKDRPVLIIGRMPGDAVAGCYLSTKEHRGFVSVGTGGWDSQGRESFLSPERLLRITDEGMRREGHVIARDRFEAAVEVVAREQGLNR